MNKYQAEMFALAFETSLFSKDPSTKVGAVGAVNKRVIGTGRNGFPPGVDDSEDLYANREIKHLLVQHAEENLISICGDQIRGGDIFVTFPVCNRCAGKLIVAGIQNVFCPVVVNRTSEWYWRWRISKALFQQVGIGIHEYYLDLGEIKQPTEHIDLRDAINDFLEFSKSNCVI